MRTNPFSRRPIRIERRCLSVILALGLPILTVCSLASPTNKPAEIAAASTGDVMTGAGSRVTNVTLSWVAGKAGWAATPLTLLGWIMATIKAKRREHAADELIRSIEAAGASAKIVKSHIATKGDSWIDRRVACLSKKHGWGAYGCDG